jgi:hypothetical protein
MNIKKERAQYGLMSSMAPRSVRFDVRSWKLSNAGQSSNGWPKFYYLELLRASEGTLSRRSRLHLQSLAPTNPHWAHVVGYCPFSLCVIHKKGLCPSSEDINRLMMMMMMTVWWMLMTTNAAGINGLTCLLNEERTSSRLQTWLPIRRPAFAKIF